MPVSTWVAAAAAAGNCSGSNHNNCSKSSASSGGSICSSSSMPTRKNVAGTSCQDGSKRERIGKGLDDRKAERKGNTFEWRSTEQNTTEDADGDSLPNYAQSDGYS